MCSILFFFFISKSYYPLFPHFFNSLLLPYIGAYKFIRVKAAYKPRGYSRRIARFDFLHCKVGIYYHGTIRKQAGIHKIVKRRF